MPKVGPTKKSSKIQKAYKKSKRRKNSIFMNHAPIIKKYLKIKKMHIQKFLHAAHGTLREKSKSKKKMLETKSEK